MKIDIGKGSVDIYVEGQLVLCVNQVSDEKTINLFLYPKGDLIPSLISKEFPQDKCTHEIIVDRK